MPVLRSFVATVATVAYRLKRRVEKASGRRPLGVHGIAVTPEGKVVLVRLTYTPGWQLPGGGRKRGEATQAALLRELREEIGLKAWRSIEPIVDDEAAGLADAARGAIFLLHGVGYRFRRSWEIDRAQAFLPAELPADTTGWTRAALARAGIR